MLDKSIWILYRYTQSSSENGTKLLMLRRDVISLGNLFMVTPMRKYPSLNKHLDWEAAVFG